MFVLFGCRYELKYENIGYFEKPVIHAFFQTDSGIFVTAFKNMPVTGPAVNAEIGNIGLKLYDGSDLFLGNLNKTSSGTFNLPAILKADSIYTIKLKSDLGDMNFKCKMPPVTNILSVDTFTSANYNSSSYFNLQFRIFNNPARISYYRYYVLEGYYKYIFDDNNLITDSAYFEQQIEVRGNEKVFLANPDNSYATNEILFSNIGLTGGNILLKTGTSALIRNNKNYRVLWVMPVLETVDENLYKFYNNRNAHIYHQNDLVSQPGTVISNIPNGYGVYGSYSKSAFRIKF